MIYNNKNNFVKKINKKYMKERKHNSITVFREALTQSFALTKKISSRLIAFDVSRTVWNSLTLIIGSGITSLGFMMITQLNKDGGNLVWVPAFIAATTIFMVGNQYFMEMGNVYKALKNEKLFQLQKAFLAEKIDMLDPARLFSSDFSKIKNKFENKGWKAMVDLYENIFMVSEGLITLVVSVGLAILLSPWVIVFAITPGIFGGLSIALSNQKVLKIWDDGHHDRVSFREYDSLMSNNWSILQTIFHNSRGYFKDRFTESRADVENNVMAMQEVRTKRKVWFVVVNTVCTIGAIIMICLSAKNGNVTVVTWPIVYGAFTGIKNAMSILGFYIADIIINMMEYKKYFIPFSKMEPMYPEGDQMVETLLTLSFNEVTFSYPSKESQRPKSAISNLSFNIEKGEMVGLIGHNGGGKTTLINMMSGIYFPDSGDISYDGISIREIKRQSLHNLMLVESSYNGLPRTTIREIVAASLDVSHDELIWKALDVVGMKSFVLELPEQLDSRIGEHWEKGRLLSAGQNKRLSLASLYFKSLDPNIEMVIMDEPMANIDPETKKDLYERITNKTLFPNKTVVVCLHDKEYEYLFPRLIKMTHGVMTEKKMNSRTNSLSFSLFQEPEYISN
jgi:ABC-type multidrug transport system fused ATPase/permease subunit